MPNDYKLDILLKEVSLRENNSYYYLSVVLLWSPHCCGDPLIQHEESFGQLVLLGYDVTTFIPVTYQRSRLLRPSMEVSSCG